MVLGFSVGFMGVLGVLKNRKEFKKTENMVCVNIWKRNQTKKYWFIKNEFWYFFRNNNVFTTSVVLGYAVSNPVKLFNLCYFRNEGKGKCVHSEGNVGSMENG